MLILLKLSFVLFQASFLPETIGVALPETLSEAANFGRSQKYFAWIRNQNKTDQPTFQTAEGEDKPLNA